MTFKHRITIIALFFASTTLSFSADFESIKLSATNEQKNIMIVFSGSDWCAPCIQFKKEVIENTTFTQFADSSLIVVHADFPRQKKNQLPTEIQKENDLLADKYNAKGIFPSIVLLDNKGIVKRIWEGKPKQNAEKFVTEIQLILDAK